MAGRPSRMHEPVTINGPQGARETTRGDYFCELLAMGRSQKNAADLAGLGEATVIEWIARGNGTDNDRDQRPEYAAFAQRAREAQAQGRAIHERTITLAAVPRQVTTVKHTTRQILNDEGEIVTLTEHSESTREEYDWRASAWFLQHVSGVQAPTQLEISGPDGGPIDVKAEAALLLARLDGFLEGRESVAAEPLMLPAGNGSGIPKPDGPTQE